MNHRVLFGWDVGRGVFEGLNRQPERQCVTANVGWVAGDDAVEFVWVAVSLQEAFTSATGAAVPIKITRLAIIERFDESLGLDGHLVFGAVGEVNELFRMTHDEAGAGTCMAIIGRAGSVATAECVCHIVVVEGASPSAAAHREKLSVPAGQREPNLGSYIGIGSGLEIGGDLTKAGRFGIAFVPSPGVKVSA